MPGKRSTSCAYVDRWSIHSQYDWFFGQQIAGCVSVYTSDAPVVAVIITQSTINTISVNIFCRFQLLQPFLFVFDHRELAEFFTEFRECVLDVLVLSVKRVHTILVYPLLKCL